MAAHHGMDEAARQALRARMQERRWLVVASLVLGVGLCLTFQAKTRDFGAVRTLLAEKDVINLNALESADALIPAFAVIYPDTADRVVAAEHLYAVLTRMREAHLLPWSLPNLGLLNTRAFAMPAGRAARGGRAFRERLAKARQQKGLAVQAALPDTVARTLRVSLLGSTTALRQLRPRLVVRTPAAYSRRFAILAGLFFAAFYGLHAFWFRRRFAGDPVLLPLVHLLTGLALLVMFSLPDPLRDLLRAEGFVAGVVAGVVLMGAVSQLDFQHPFWHARPFRWLWLSLLVAGVLYVFGSGPTGSDARVNLTLPFVGSIQPVELVKLALVLFLAGYFARHWQCLRELKQRDGLPRLLQRLDVPRYRDLLPVAAGVGGALGAFYLLKEMGPVLVMGCTFLVLYGIVRNRWPAVGMGFAGLLAGFWYAYATDAVPRVAGRIAMMLSPWENFVDGGDHLAHAYWAMAAGGVTGQGLGGGHPGYIPAAHTDLVLPALGEELGFLGLLVVLVLYGVLVVRALRISLRSGGVFSLFLGLSITLLTLFQVVLIAGGAFGLVPLSGVVTPLLSYGKSSMAVHCALIGMLMSLSARPGAPVQDQAQQRHFERPVFYLSVAGVLLLGMLAGRAGYVQIARADAWSIKPTLVPGRDGARTYLYNPRLLEARRQLTRGTIYDRNGLPLATSRWGELEGFRATYDALGVDLDRLDRTDERYYPFGSLTFYLLGDVRTRVKWGAPNSLYAEHAYLSYLRGYDNYPAPIVKKRTVQGAPEPIVRYDYAELLPLVRRAPVSWAAQALLQRDRDLYLTVDVRLQQRVAQAMRALVPEGKTASAVVLDAATGDVLASVTYPLPDTAFTDPAAAHRDPNLFDRGYGRGAKPPGSTFKLVTAMAALNAGAEAARWTHPVRSWDRYARRGEPTGEVDLARAVIASSNVYFAALAHDVVGPDSLLQMLEHFGFGVGSPQATTAEKLALLRAPDNLRQAGFGQGPVTASPLEVARVSATIANGGALPEVRWVHDPAHPRPPARYVVLPGHARILADYMRRVVTDREGTGRTLRTSPVPIAGKSGTAEEKRTVLREGKRVRVAVNHAWFTGFAPYDAPGIPSGPKIAFAVLVEEGGMGGRVAAPIAGAIVQEAADLGLIARDLAPDSTRLYSAGFPAETARPGGASP